jgi:hypothetical protein
MELTLAAGRADVRIGAVPSGLLSLCCLPRTYVRG